MTSLEKKPTSETYEHPLFAVLEGEAVSLDGHLEHGVMAVLRKVAINRHINVTGQTIRLVNDPNEVTETIEQ